MKKWMKKGETEEADNKGEIARKTADVKKTKQLAKKLRENGKSCLQRRR